MGEASSGRSIVFNIYVALGIIGFVGMWRSALLYVWDGGDWSDFWQALTANHAATMLTIEMTIIALAATVWMWTEGKRFGFDLVRRLSLVGAAAAIGYGVIVPFFLAYREQRRAETQLTLI
jgi:hypothetical protein